jgi:hypothetical protein
MLLTTALLLLITLGHTKGLYDYETDTIIMEFGGNSRIIILVEKEEDLRALQSYDLNKMLRDISVSIDSAEEDTDYLTIQDDEGDRYLRDTTIVVRNRQRDEIRDERRYRNGVNIKVANYELEARDLEDIGDELDDLDPLEFSDYKKSDRIERRTWGTRHAFNLEFGLTNWLENGKFPDANNAQYTIKPWGSWFVGLASTHKTSVGGPLFVEWGGNFTWFNWKFDDTETRITKEATETVFTTDNTVNGIKSKLSASYINAHFVPMLDFSYGRRRVKTYEKGSLRVTKYKRRGFRIGAGGYAGYRLGSHTRVVYKDGGDKEKDKENSNFFMNNFRYGIRGQIGYKGYDFFVNYDLNEVFSDNRGPSLNAISFGIIL